MNFDIEQSLARATVALSRAAAVLTTAVGVAVLCGWFLSIRPLINISPHFATMKVNTAICFVFLGISLWLANARGADARMSSRWGKSTDHIVRVFAVVVLLIGALTLSQYLFGWNLGIDNLLIRDHYTIHAPHPGRMSRMTALDFILLGAAFLIMDVETRKGRRPAQWLAIVVALDGYIGVLGYVYGVQSFYRVQGYGSTAIHTAIVSFLISAGFLLARPGKGLMFLATDTTAGGRIFRGLLPAAILVMPVLGWLKLRGQGVGLYGLEFGTALLVICNVVLMSWVIWRLAGYVRAEVLGRTAVEEKMETEQEQAARQAAVLEQRVRERTVKLEEAVAELEHSTYTISHNLRAPVRSVLAFSDFLIADCKDKLDETGRDYLERIKASTLRMDRLIEGVLAYSRASRSKAPLGAVDLDKLLEELVPDYARGAEVQISHPLGTVRANGSLLEQAVSNLLENAVKFVKPGTKPQIEVWCEPDDGKLRLIVHDHGIGVPAENDTKIFRSFERAHEGYTGTGIGLAIVKRAVERMNGHVGFNSKAGEGSSFWVELPKADGSSKS